jgi:2-methylcitrate dehydratase
VEIEHDVLGHLSSGLVMYPVGHARNSGEQLAGLLAHKFHTLAGLAVADPQSLAERLSQLKLKTAHEVQQLYDFNMEHVWIA